MKENDKAILSCRIACIIAMIILLTGCIRDTKFTKVGTIVDVDEYLFGFTFSNHMSVLTYLDGSTLELTGYYDNSHRYIRNETSKIIYSKFEYDGIEYNRFERFEIITEE